MEPLGTITKYYPFIDEEIQKTLNSIMEKSSSYFDFVRRLSTVVLEDEAPSDLVYIAVAQTWLVKEHDLIKPITKKYENLACIKLWKTSFNALHYLMRDEYQKIREAMDGVIESSVADWMVVEQFLTHAVNLNMPLESIRYLSIAQEMISQKSDLQCFEPLVQISEGRYTWREGNLAGAITHIQRGLKLARDHDDAVYEYFSLLMLANHWKLRNHQEGLDIFEQAYQIAQTLEVPFFISEILNDSSMAYEIAGEYDLAISSQVHGLNSFDGDVGNEICYVILSRLYAALGDGQQALDWADRAMKSPSKFTAHLKKARALILLNRFDEAEQTLDIVHRKVLEAGLDLPLSRYYYISGLLEMAKGELRTAQSFLEQSYEIASQRKSSIYLNDTLIALAQVELALLKESGSNAAVTAGKWLSTLENHAQTYDLPGISMQAAMIKSEMFQSQGQLMDAHETLQQALEISDSPGVNTLRKRISARISEIRRLMLDEEMVS